MAGSVPSGWKPLFTGASDASQTVPEVATIRDSSVAPSLSGWKPLFTARAPQASAAQGRGAPPAAVDVSEIDKALVAQIQARQRLQAEYAAELKKRIALYGPDARYALQSEYGAKLANAQAEIDALKARRTGSISAGKLLTTPSALDIAKEVPKGALRGAVRGVSDIAGLAGIAGPTGEALAKGARSLGESAIKFVGAEENPAMQYSTTGQQVAGLSEVLGGVAPFLLTEGAGAAAKTTSLTGKAATAVKAAGVGAKGAEVAMASGMGANQARQQMDDYEARTGQKIDPMKRAAIQAGGGIIGTAMMGIPKAILRKVAPETAVVAEGRIADILAALGESRIAKSEAVAAIKGVLEEVSSTAAGRAVVKGAIPAAAIMGGMQAGQNVLEMDYNPEKRSLAGLGENVGEAALMGGLTGGILRGGAEALSTRAQAAAKRQAALDALAQKPSGDYGTFDVISMGGRNKVQRESVKVVSEPDANGKVLVQRADGTLADWSLKDLEKSQTPSGSLRAVPVPETLSRTAIATRLKNALGDFTPDEYLDAFVRKTADQAGDAVVLGQPENLEGFLSKQDKKIGAKRKISEESRIGHSLVLDEARKILDEYTDLVTTPPKGVTAKEVSSAAKPGTAPVVENVPTPPSIEEVVRNRAMARQEENTRRTSMLDRIASDPSITDKPSAFEDMLDQSGYDTPTPHEIAHLHDAMRLEAEQETAASLTGARVEDIHAQEQRRAGVGRVDIIEDHLYDPEASARKKLDRINADLEAAGLNKLNEDEVNRYQAVADAIAAYGPKGERQQVLERIAADPTLEGEAKLEVFRKEVKGEPTEEELAVLGKGTAELEAQIKPAAEQPELPVEPTVIERAPATARSGEIAAEATAANQRILEARARAEESRANVDRINQEIAAQQAKLDAQPHKGTPAARQAINTLKTLEAERATVETQAAKAEEPPAKPTLRAEGEPTAKPEDVVIMGGEPVNNRTVANLARKQRGAIAANWRMANWYKNIISQFGGAKGVEASLAKSMGLETLPSKLSVNDRFEMLATNRNGEIREIKRRFTTPAMKEIARLYDKYGITADEVSDALQARGASQRNAKVARTTPGFEGHGSSLSAAEANAILTELKLSGKLQKMGTIIKIHDAARKFTQDKGVELGLFSREKMNQFIAEEPDYTPYKGWAKSGDLTVEGDVNPHADYGKPEYFRKPLGVSQKTVRKAEGRTTRASNSLLNMLGDAETVVSKGAHNKPGLKLLELLEAQPAETADIGRIVPKRGEDTITVMREGKPYYVRLENTVAGNAMRAAFAEMADPIVLNRFLRGLTKTSGILRGVHTTFSPLFWQRAFRKDVHDMVVFALSEKSMKDSPLYEKNISLKAGRYALSPEMHRGIISYLRDTTPSTPQGVALKKMVAEMVEAGGSAGYAFREHAQNLEARLQQTYNRLEATGAKRALLETEEGRKALTNFVHGVNDHIDIAPRFALYRAAVEAGIPPSTAAKVALESTLNLPRRGRWGSAIDAIKWYTNAGIQSAVKKKRMLNSSNGRKILAAHMALGSAIAAWNISVAGDKDNDGKNDYLELPAWQKAGSLVIYSPSGKSAFTLPLGFMTSFETYFGQKMTELAYGLVSEADATIDLRKALTDVMEAGISSQLPLGRAVTASDNPWLNLVGIVVPDSVKPLIFDVPTNKNAFGEDIANIPFNKEQARSSVPRASTPQIYKDWSSWLNDNTGGHGKFASRYGLDISPEVFQYLVNQYTGGTGKFARDIAGGKNPAAKEFVVDESHAVPTQYYELNSRMKQAVEAFGPTGIKNKGNVAWAKANRPVDTDPRVRAAFKQSQKQLDAIKARESHLQKIKVSATQKEALATKIDADRKEAMAAFLRVYNRVAATK